MRSTTLLFGFGQLAAAQYYTLVDDYNPTNFFDKFNFMTFANGDGTGGFVDYKDKQTATTSNLIKNFGHSVVFRADNTTRVEETSKGRPAVRLEGTAKYNKGVIVADIQHMPGNACGAWPAFWSFGDNWPHDGEIDIVEGVNSMTQNKMSLHAGNAVCTVQDSLNADRGVPALNNGQPAYDCRTMTGANVITNSVGCGIDAPSNLPNTFGDGFNSVNGGYYATQWTSTFIKVWFWPRGREPETLHCDVPNVAEFGTPLAFFQGDCDFGNRFQNQHLVFSTNFCGSWAGAVGVYDQEYSKGCPNYGLATPDLSCRREVATNPGRYTNQYWEVNGIKVYGETSTPGSGVCKASSSSSSRIASSTSSVRPSSSSAVVSVSSSASHASSSSAAAVSSSAPARSSSSVAAGVSSSAPARSSSASHADVVSSAPHGSSAPASSAAPVSSRGGNNGGNGGNGQASITSSYGAQPSSSKVYDGDDDSYGAKPSSSKAYGGGYDDDTYGAKSSSSKAYDNGYGAKPTSSKAAYGGSEGSYDNTPVKQNEIPAGCSPIKVPYTTKYTTTIVDVCPTGLTTKTVTTNVPYCPMCHEYPTSPYNGFVEEVKVCTKGCAPSAIPVTVTVPYDGAYNGVKPTGDAKASYDAKPVVSAKPSGAVEPYWSAKTTVSAKPAYGGDYDVDAKPVGGAYTPKPYTPSGASNPVYTTSKTYQPVLATVNGASTTFASAFVVGAAAFAAVLMM